MKTKLKSLLALTLLMMCMSSCVIYSLFPIWTEDTLVYLPELEGKWVDQDSPNDYIIFEPGFDEDATIKIKHQDDKQTITNAKITKNFKFEVSHDAYIIQNGDTIRDKEKIKSVLENDLDSLANDPGVNLVKTLANIGKAMNDMDLPGKQLKYDTEYQTYQMRVHTDGKDLTYQAHLARIGEDIFVDLFASESQLSNDALESMVWFPVHMFMKLELNGDRLILTQFDHQKMSDLFDSNLIRMRHENVDGSILITAQSVELQKFLDRYSKDESVFEEPGTYERVK